RPEPASPSTRTTSAATARPCTINSSTGTSAPVVPTPSSNASFRCAHPAAFGERAMYEPRSGMFSTFSVKVLVLVLVFLASCADNRPPHGDATDAGDTDTSWEPMPDAEVEMEDRRPSDPFGPYDRATPDRPPSRDTGNPLVSGDSSTPNDSTVPPDVEIAMDA